MVRFEEISLKEFLNDYWQKNPLVIRNALPGFVNAITPDELAGFAMEEDIESRIVFETPNKAPYWHLKRGPFLENDFSSLPETHWTLLVQGIDRFVPEIHALCDHFDFIPQWRMDDVMISFAAEHGSVGPHYDNYDVFLYQAKGGRKWTLTTQNCNESNYLAEVDLRIMRQFEVEEVHFLEEGDMLYLPPHVGHYGISTSAECMTYSFGYRSYQGQELWDSFADYLSQNKQAKSLYIDPNWFPTHNSAEVPRQAWLNAKHLLLQLLEDETYIKDWFAGFVTQLDQQAEALMPQPVEDDLAIFRAEFADCEEVTRNPFCRFAYQLDDKQIRLFINGMPWDVADVTDELVKLIANSRVLTKEAVKVFCSKQKNEQFLHKLWQLQYIELII